MARDKFLSTAPTSEQLRKELEREKNKLKGNGFFIGLIIALIVIDTTIIILTTMFFPIMSIDGNSMSPNLEDGNLVIAVKTDDLERGDVCVFHSGNSVLCKRIIAYGGEVVDIDANGVVYIDNVPLDEPYISKAALGNTNIEFPYTVPEHAYFVMGDNRPVSVDSRDTQVGCVFEDQMIGKIVFRFWPLNEIGVIKQNANIRFRVNIVS